MTKLFWAAVIGVAIAVGSMHAYEHLAATTQDLKHVAELFYFVATVALFWHTSRSHGLGAMLGLGVVITVVTELEVQGLELYRSGSVFKVITPFTWDHASFGGSTSQP